MNKCVVGVLTALMVAGAVPVLATECEGYNSETGAWVYGECSDGGFEGYDSETGSYVSGDYSDGEFEGYDSETGAYVSGESQ